MARSKPFDPTVPLAEWPAEKQKYGAGDNTPDVVPTSRPPIVASPQHDPEPSEADETEDE